MISIGAVMTLTQAGVTSPAVSALVGGTILTTVGSILLSWTLSKLVAVETATEAFRQRLKPINLNIGQQLGSIRNIVKLSWAEEDINGVKRQLRESAENIRLQVGHVQSLIGQHYDTSETDETFEKLDQQQERLAGAVKEGDTKAIEEANREIAKSVDDLRKTFGAKSSVSAACPNCGADGQGSISDAPNTTAHIRCVNCGVQYPIHRNPQGVLIVGKVTSAIRSAVPVPVVSRPRVAPTSVPILASTTPSGSLMPVVCPKCGAHITLRHHAIPGPREVVCLGCNSGLSVQEDGTPSLNGEFALHGVETVIRLGKRQLGVCPTCGEAYPFQMKRDGRQLGFCLKDRIVLWRNDDEPEPVPIR